MNTPILMMNRNAFFVLSALFLFSLTLKDPLQGYAQAQECQTLLPLYQKTLEELAHGEKLFLSQGCSDQSDHSKCKKLAMAIREMQGSLGMFSLRLKALKCDPQKKTKTPCQRLHIMKKKATQELNHIESILKAQNCFQSSYQTGCSALTQKKKSKVDLLRALHLKIEQKCKTALKNNGK